MADKNLQELMAAIGDGPSSSVPQNSGSFTQSPGGMSLPSAGLPAVNATPQQVSAAPVGPGSGLSTAVDQNFSALVSLLGGGGNSTKGARQAAPAAPANPVTAYPGARVPMMTAAAQRAAAQQNFSGSQVRGMNPTAVTNAQYRKRQKAVAAALQKREPALAGSASFSSNSGAVPARPASRQGVIDIASELNALQESKSSARPRAQTSRAASSGSGSRVQRGATAQSAKTAVRPVQSGAPPMAANGNVVPGQVPVGAGRGQPRGGAPGQPPGNAQGGGQRTQITQEQRMVGHFCRHAIKTLSRVMQNHPQKEEKEARLKEHMKSVWTSWVKGMITGHNLLESVASFVRSSCAEAKNIDVIKEFNVHYAREFELQKRRAEQERMRALQQQQRQQLQMLSQGKQHRTGPGGHPTMAGANDTQEQLAAARARATPAQGAAASAKLAAAKDPQRMASGSQMSVNPVSFAGNDPQLSQASRQAGKAVPGPTLQQRKPPTAKGPRAVQKPGAGKSIGNKSVGGKGIRRQPVAMPKGQVGFKEQPEFIQASPTSMLGSTATGSKGLVAGKGVAGSKGLVGNKGLSGAKPKPQRKVGMKLPPRAELKTSPKGAQKAPPKPPLKGSSPKGALMKQKMSPADQGLVSPSSEVATLPVTGKRPLEGSMVSPTGSKKSKTAAKSLKPNVGRKKAVVLPLGGTTPKGMKPAPIGPDALKARIVPVPGQAVATPGMAGILDPKAVAAGVGAVNAAQLNQTRKVRRVDDELSVVHNVIDIEDEEDMLGRDAGAGTADVVEVLDYDSDMLLAGPTLKLKMQRTARRFGHEERISKDALEMMSLAVRERLATFLEKLKVVSKTRLETAKSIWKTEASGPNMYQKLEQVRQDEERSLTVAAEMRIKRKKEQEERGEKKLIGETTQEEKKTKDPAAAEAERKEKLALEKKRKEHSSQSDALSGLLAGIDKRRKRPNMLKGLAPLGPIGKLPSLGGAKSGSSGLPPIVKRTPGDLGNKGFGSSRGGPMTAQEQLQALGPLVKLGDPRPSSMLPNALRNVGKDKVAKQPLTLRDCLFLMESEQNTRKSSLLYKWHARLGAKT